MAASNDRVSDLARRLRALVDQDPEEYRLGEPVEAAALSAFEREHGVTLPDDYRAFLLEVGQGASGPVYGMLTLAAGIKERGATIYGLADPFPEPETVEDHLDFAVGGILPICFAGCSYYQGLVISGPCRGEIWGNLEERPGWVPAWRDGLLGPDDEPVVCDGDDYGALYAASLDPRNKKLRQGFAAWYAAWLEEQEEVS
jgi:hypothetical protein